MGAVRQKVQNFDPAELFNPLDGWENKTATEDLARHLLQKREEHRPKALEALREKWFAAAVHQSQTRTNGLATFTRVVNQVRKQEAVLSRLATFRACAPQAHNEKQEAYVLTFKEAQKRNDKGLSDAELRAVFHGPPGPEHEDRKKKTFVAFLQHVCGAIDLDLSNEASPDKLPEGLLDPTKKQSVSREAIENILEELEVGHEDCINKFLSTLHKPSSGENYMLGFKEFSDRLAEVEPLAAES